MLVQLYLDGLMRAFKDRNSSSVFEVQNVTYRELDFLGLPRVGTKGTWHRVSWGWEIEVDFQSVVRSNKASSRLSSMSRKSARKSGNKSKVSQLA